MFLEIFRFELRFQMRQPIFWISAVFFSLITFFAVTTDAIVIGGSIGNVNRNAPFVIQQMLLVMSILGVFVTTAFVASPILRDAETRTQEIFFSTPVSKRDFLLGRFCGALAAAFLFFVPIALAIFIGGFMPWLDPERVGPVTLAPYLSSLLVIAWPNTLLTGAIFFGIATWTRSMIGTYVGVVALFSGYLIAGTLASDVENEAKAALLDPLGGSAFAVVTKYWTVVERNTRIVELSGAMLDNRLLWVGVALLLLGVTYWRFSFRVAEGRKARRLRRKESDPAAADGPVAAPGEAIRASRQVFGRGTAWGQYLARARFEIGGVVKSVAFPVILAFGVMNMVGNSTGLDSIYGTPVYPVTNLMVRILQGAFLFVFIILTFYAGELVFRDREQRFDEVSGAMPVPTWVMWSSKLTALVTVLLALLVSAILTGIGIQAFRDFHNFEIALYLKGFLLALGVPMLLAAVLAIFFQVATNHKYAGFLLMILYFISGPTLQALDFNHNLYQYGGAPSAPYSDMNGYGHFVAPLTWFYIYWSFFAAMLVVLIHLFWVRGKEGGLKVRLRIARQRFTPALRAVSAVALIGCLAVGGWIFYNTNILNDYIPGDVLEANQASFEHQYKQYEGMSQPRIVAAYADVDIFPDRRWVDIRGRYTTVNKTGDAIRDLHFLLNPQMAIREVEIPGATLTTNDSDLGYYIYRLDAPLMPGEELQVSFDIGIESRGFVNHNSNINVVHNGTFFNSAVYFPHIGYNRAFELGDPNDRRKHDLPPIQRFAKLEDMEARQNTYLGTEADWIDFETVVSTSSDQIALAPGYLQKEWSEGDRRYFHYKMDAPILAFWAYLSADWEVARDSWNDVAIEIYHHPSHPFNVERMIDATKKSLDYFSREFGPYQHRQVRIIEFPRYASFAQSFPNTIPFSESIGFIARLDEEDDEAIDYVFYVTAHEIAHQWWAHQVIGGNVQGATVLSETMSQYSALMVMEHEYGRDKMKRFLKYELDNYLRSRGGELIEELPLLRVENQPYIHYRKGSVVMYALKDYLGEERLNDAILAFAEQTRFQQPPFTTSLELLDFIRAEASPEEVDQIADLFERITIYDTEAETAEYVRRDDGRYEVRMEIAAAKYRADGEGNESEVAVDDWIDVGVFGAEEEGGSADGKVLLLEKRRLTEPTTEIVVVVDEEPLKAGIDPYNKLVDRNPENNVTRVKQAEVSR